jgi:hypothetical protein
MPNVSLRRPARQSAVWRLLAALLSVVLLMSGAAWPSAHARTLPQWRAQSGPPEDVLLNDVAAVRDGNLWVVGGVNPYGPYAAGRAMIAHRVGGSWTRARQLAPSTQLSAVAARPGSVWAVGYRIVDDPATVDVDLRGLIWRRSEGRWRPVCLAPVTEYTDVAMTASNNVWIVGYVGRFESVRGVILHYDGHRWRRYMPDGLSGSEEMSLTVASPRDVWVTDSGPRTFHFDGKRWRKETIPSPIPLRSEDSYQVTKALAATPDGKSVWAVGYADSGLGGGCGDPHFFLAHHTRSGWRLAGHQDDRYITLSSDLMIDRKTREVLVTGGNFEISTPCDFYYPIAWGFKNGAWKEYPIPTTVTSPIVAIDADGQGNRYAITQAVGPSARSILFMRRPTSSN